jgi:hypothetical protein
VTSDDTATDVEVEVAGVSSGKYSWNISDELIVSFSWNTSIDAGTVCKVTFNNPTKITDVNGNVMYVNVA